MQTDHIPGGATCRRHIVKTFWLLVLFALAGLVQAQNNPAPSRLLTVEGKVEVARGGAAAWSAGVTNMLLQNGDRVRTGLRSRATLQLSDRSVLRVNELTTLEIRPPQNPGANSGFELKRGAGYFFNRERPGSVEFRTPLASGAIRGTEFHLLVAENGRTELALVDGLVDLQNEIGTANLVSGEQAVIEASLAPRKSPLLNASAVLQWVLYYPAILDLDEVALSDAERAALSGAIAAYRDGDLLAAVESYPDNRPLVSDAEKVFRAGTLLAAGQAGQAAQLLQNLDTPPAAALRQLMDVVQGRPASRGPALTLATEWLAESYALQARLQLEEALAAARSSVQKSPGFGAGWVRVAELEFSFGRAAAAESALARALELSPRHAQALALRGFAQSARGRFGPAEDSFEQAIFLDGGLADAWLGRGLLRIRRGRDAEGRQDLQVAATLEPQRSILRSYLGKAWSQTRDSDRAEKELRLAQKLDANDPTPWLYSAIQAAQQNKVNEAVRDLEKSQELNDNRGLYRSRLLLDQDKAMRSVNLAHIYYDAGMTDWSVREASRAVSYDYGNFSAHQFLANSYDALRDPGQLNLRYEAAAVSEYFIANLLAPVGGTRLSSTVSQQEYTRLFDVNYAGLASSTEYFSNGDWVQQGVAHGRSGDMDWALESLYRTENGWRANNDVERMDFTLKVRMQLAPQDSIYFEAQRNEYESGDVNQYYDPAGANLSTRINELQNPNLFLGYHHEWSPGNHTLVLLGQLDDAFGATYKGSGIELFHNGAGDISSTTLRPFRTSYHGTLEGYTAELQQILTVKRNTIIGGVRYQNVDSDARDLMQLEPGTFPGAFVYPASLHVTTGEIERFSAYAYDKFQVLDQLHLTAGVTYDSLSFPRNQDTAPVGGRDEEISRVSPKAGLIWLPVPDTTMRAVYTRSLGGVFFDNSFRLEPTEVAGFNQSYRSLVPESLAGTIPGTRFETYGVGFDQKFASGTYFTVVGESLNSEANRAVGVFKRYAGQIEAVPSSTRAKVDYRECSVALALNQLVSDNWAFGVRYKLTDASFRQQLKEIPATVVNPGAIDADVKQAALLHQVQLYASYTHRCGFFSELNALWTAQDNREESKVLADDDFWQLNAFIGYRFARRHAEARIGVLNLTDDDYRLNPVTLYSELPRERTFYASFKFYF